MSLLKWKCGVWAFFWRVGRLSLWSHHFNMSWWKKFIKYNKNVKKSFILKTKVTKSIKSFCILIRGRPTRQKKAQTSYFHLSKRIKWSLKFHLSIFQFEVIHKMTPKSWLVTTSTGNNHLSNLSDHLTGFIKWKYEVKPFQIRIERLHRCSQRFWMLYIVKSTSKTSIFRHCVINWSKSLK